MSTNRWDTLYKLYYRNVTCLNHATYNKRKTNHFHKRFSALYFKRGSVSNLKYSVFFSLKIIFYFKIEKAFCLTSSAILFSLSISSSPFVSPVFSNASTACKAIVLALIISPAFMSKLEATRRECPSDLFDKLMCESCHLDRSSNFEIGVEY